jgi:hypothetical protein
MGDQRYSSARWRKLRAAVLARDGYLCQIGGPRCVGHATTADHINPVAIAPDMFWEPDNVRAACAPCNAGRGAAFKNQRTRITIAQLQEIVLQQSHEIDRLREQLAAYERPEPKPRPTPAIY